MDNLIKEDTVFGKRVNVVGNISADLVLESLGKVYIKSRNKALTLEELITSLVNTDPNTSTSRVELVEGIEGLDITKYKEGTFVFDKLSNILYLFLDDELLELINVAPEGTGYVKRSGDTMTGRLAIYVKNGAPLYVNSSTLVENLNALYLDGDTAETFARKHKNEQITGSWTFRNATKFKSSISVEKDIITNGSVGSPSFASGFGGYGWRMDADTNTLTIDNLVVRKLMKVYELVVNKISATNGSLWVSNAGKVIFVLKLEIKPPSFFSDTADYRKFCNSAFKDFFFIKYADGMSDTGSPSIAETESLTSEAFDTASGTGRNVKVCLSLNVLRSMLLVRVLQDKQDQVRNFNNFSGLVTAQTTVNGTPLFSKYSLFDSDFKFDCVFPIVNRNNKLLWDNAMNNVRSAESALLSLIRSKASDSAINALRQTLLNLLEAASPSNFITMIRSYYKYFAGGDFYVVRFDDDSLPVFKPGDLLRCLKWTHGGIKYYDAVVCNYIDEFFIILLADSILDKKTTISYNSSLNPTYTIEEDTNNTILYNTSVKSLEVSLNQSENVNVDENGNITTLSAEELFKLNLLGIVEEKDGLVLMGHLWDKQRLNAVYITSTDDAAPYMDVLSGINRPDYSVIYYVPIYLTTLLYQTSYNLRTFSGFNNLVEIPYTGEYYIQDSFILNFTCEYVSFTSNNVLYLAKGKLVPSDAGIQIKHYLNTIPDACTLLGGEPDNFYITLEDGGKILLQSGAGAFILENLHFNLAIVSTRTVKARLGNLDGIRDELFPIEKLPYGYGLYGLNVFLTGEFYLSNGQAVADLGKEAMAFAVASSEQGNATINTLRADLTRADNLLRDSTYSKGTLRTAGMYIGNDSYGYPGIVIWGNKIIFATNDAEFSGLIQPTMLLQDGKIRGKYLGVDEAHANNIAQVPLSSFTVGNDSYVSSDIGNGTVRVFRPKVRNPNSPSGTSYFEEGTEVYYVRRFIKNEETIVWLLVNPDGYPTITNLYGVYTLVAYPTFIYYDSSGIAYTYSTGILPLSVELAFVNEYTTPLKVWSLEVNGNANIGGHTLYVDLRGLVIVSGILRSTEGNIGGLFLSQNGLFTYDNTYTYNPIDLNTINYGYGENSMALPYLKFSVGNNGLISHRTIFNAKGLFYQASPGINLVSQQWNDYLSFLTPSVSFALTVVPIINGDDLITLYARLSSSTRSVFGCIDIGFDKHGNWCINFPLMNYVDTESTTTRLADWFVQQLKKGTIHFSTTAYNCGFSNENFTYNSTINNQDNMLPIDYFVRANYFAFNPARMEDAPDRYFYMTTLFAFRREMLKASIDQISFHTMNQIFNPYLVDNNECGSRYPYVAFIRANLDLSYQGKYDSGGIYGIITSDSSYMLKHWNNAILITTADDNSENLGGFTLMCWYLPVFDTLYLTTPEAREPEFNQTAIDNYENQYQPN